MFNEASKDYQKLHTKAKRAHYISSTTQAASDQGSLFKLTDKLLHKNSDPVLPQLDSPTNLANNFASFFNDKITKIQSSPPPH